LQSLPVLSGPSKSLSIDFITDLPLSRLQKEVYNSILVIINYFTKLGTYISCKKSINAKELANIVTKRIFNIYGYPDSIITNQGSLFTSRFWSKLMYQFGIKQQLSTVFHPQIDGQTERLNQVIEHYLHCYTNQQQDN
jgi:transposase InsO family protein